MTKLIWDEAEKHIYTTGTSHGVLQVSGATKAVAWNGLIGVTATPAGADENKFYANNNKYLGLRGVETFGGTIKAYDRPDEFEACDGSVELQKGLRIHQQTRLPFDFSWQTIKGNDAKLDEYGYEIHIAYNCTASPSARDYTTVNESPAPLELSWEFQTTPVAVENAKPTSYVTIDSTKVDQTKLKKIVDALYGTQTTEAKIPSINELVTMIKTA